MSLFTEFFRIKGVPQSQELLKGTPVRLTGAFGESGLTGDEVRKRLQAFIEFAADPFSFVTTPNYI